MRTLPLPPLEFLEQAFLIDDTSPSGLRWKKSKSTRVKPGDVAGTKSSRGYWNVYINDRRYKVHRILYYMRTGIDPGQHLIDHAPRDPSDNAILRIASSSQNGANRQKSLYKQKKTHSQHKGVTWHKQHKKWLAQIIVNAKKSHLGYFQTELEAASAYNEAALEAWGEFAVLNNLDSV